MDEQSLEIRCNGKLIATKAMFPETEREKAKGMYNQTVVPGKVMMFLYMRELPQIFDMMWMKERLGYIALDKDKKVISVGILIPWISFKLVRCMTFIEGHPSMTTGINKGDQITWQEKPKIFTTSEKVIENQTKIISHPEMQ